MTGQTQVRDSAASQMLGDRGHDAALDANRFGFGANCRQFLALFDQERVAEAVGSIEVFDYFRKRGYSLRRLRCASGVFGCNEFVFGKGSTKP